MNPKNRPVIKIYENLAEEWQSFPSAVRTGFGQFLKEVEENPSTPVVSLRYRQYRATLLAPGWFVIWRCAFSNPTSVIDSRVNMVKVMAVESKETNRTVGFVLDILSRMADNQDVGKSLNRNGSKRKPN
jgi:hypothetical protein